MEPLSLPATAAGGPTKPPVRALVLDLLALAPEDHVVDVGACTGAVAIEAAYNAGQVTAIERDPDKCEAIRENLTANGIDPAADQITVETATAPEGLPSEADAVFIGGGRNREDILAWAASTGADCIVATTARIESAAETVELFSQHNLLETVTQVRVDRGYDLAGGTGLKADNPVFVTAGGGGCKERTPRQGSVATQALADGGPTPPPGNGGGEIE